MNVDTHAAPSWWKPPAWGVVFGVVFGVVYLFTIAIPVQVADRACGW